MKRFLRNLILGREKFVEDYSVYRRALLLGYLELISVLIATFYFFMDLSRGYTSLWSYYIIVVVSVFAWLLIRSGHYTLATLVQTLMVSGVVFYFALNSKAGSNYLYFLGNALSSFALFGYKRRWMATFTVLLNLALFVVSYTGAFGYIEKPMNTYLLINYIFVFTTCVLVMYFILAMHEHSEKITKAKNIQLQKANAELDRFVYSASHDLRAPLSSLLGLIELTRKTDDRAEIDTYLQMMKGRINHLDEFIKEIIDYSRNERMEIVRQPINLRELIEETIGGLRQLEGAENIEIQNEIPGELVLQSDAMRLKIVLNNLLNNAIKYHDPNKAKKYIHISVETSALGSTFSIADNGMGIAREHLDKVFNMFYRASDKSKGSGLGLYIVRESLSQLGGSITVQSELGEGSTFTVSIPH